MRVMTWNINSVRLREPIVLQVMRELDPDIVCLQETKCPDEHFPFENFKALGYEYTHIHGMKSYNGVAILSRVPFKKPQNLNRVGRTDCRHVMASFKDFDLHNIYIPAGGDEPDVAVNDKYAHKLDFVDELTDYFPGTYNPSNPVIAVGDFNIAPLEHDVWSSRQLQNIVSHTPPEREKLAAFLHSLNFTDAIRYFVPEEQKCYTWWSYRNKDWKASNRGRRLDHIWVTNPLTSALKGHHIHNPARDFAQPSDHVPVILDLDT